MRTRLLYSPQYDFNVMGLQRLHPFDAKKFSKAWALLAAKCGDLMPEITTFIDSPVSDQALSTVHDPQYIASLNVSNNIAKVIEVSALRFVPNFMLQRGLIRPTRFATAGTIEAARQAIAGAIAFNIGGGFHHAFADHGEGFCFFADAALALEVLKGEGRLATGDKVVMIDLDAHRGNGFASFYEHEKSVGIFDLYNMQTYPGLKPGDPDDFPFIIPMRAGLGSEEYLELLKTELPKFFKAYPKPKLAFYNAGTDIVSGDSLGGLNISFDAVKQRDRFVVDFLREQGIPTVIMTSGGYSGDSYKLVADLAEYLVISGS